MAVIRSGWSAHYVLFPDGRRQIADLLLPGDSVGFIQKAASDAYPVAAISDTQACLFDADDFLGRVFTRSEYVLEMLRECGSKTVRLWQLLAAIGRQSGVPRIAAFIRTLYQRLSETGDATETRMPYYLRQQDLADVLGMTQVHVSRILRGFQEAEILMFNDKAVTILDHTKLDRLAKT